MLVRLFLLTSVVSLAGCAAPQRVHIQSLLEEPDKYAGEKVEVCGWFVMRMEECSLAPAPNYEELSVWVLPRTEACLPKNWFKNPRAEWALVSGEVQTGGGYGHLGMYETVLVGGTIRRQRDCGELGET
jgi:hypothetical protein